MKMKPIILCLLVAAVSSKTVPQKEQDDRIYAFQVGLNKRPGAYIDEIGNINGFIVEIYKVVCEQAGKKCQFEKRKDACGRYTELGTKYIIGEDLAIGYVDACEGGVVTPEAQAAGIAFTDPIKPGGQTFLVKKGNPRAFQPQANLTGKKLAYFSGQYTGTGCLERLGFSGFELVEGSTVSELEELVNSEKVDALFSFRTFFADFENPNGQIYDCTGDTGVAVLEGSSIPDWWNPAFKAIVENGVYKDICDSSEEKHGGPASCFEV